MSVNLDEIVISHKFNHSEENFKYFIGYQEGEIVNRYALSSHKWVDTSNTLKTGAKTCLFFIKDGEMWQKYAQIWVVIKNAIKNT